MSFWYESCDALRRAIDVGVIDPTLSVWAWWGELDTNVVSALQDQLEAQRRPHEWVGKQSTWQQPRTRRHQVSNAPSTLPVTQTSPTLPWLVELARWPVSYGSFGLVKGVEQYLSHPELQGQVILSTSPYWGDPWPLGLSQSIEWHFRLSPIYQGGLPWVTLTGPQAIVDRIPGQPYDDLPVSDGLWYAAGGNTAANVHLPVPGGQILRVFLRVGAQSADSPLSAFCRLTGTTQVETSSEAQYVARTTW